MRTIKTAIILAAGRGSRMGELTNDKPKCMMEIKGKTVIQRTIEVFKNKNIKRIVVVTGYKSDVLRSHLESLFNDLIFIHNDQWETSNSIVSMSLASDYLKDAVVIDSDIYINNPDCIRDQVSFSGYSAVNNSNYKEWQLIINNLHRICDVRFHGNFYDGLPIIDISYWTEEDGMKVAKFIKEILSYNKKKDRQRYWDEIPLVDCFSRFRLERYEIEETDAMEFDDKFDLDKVRKIVC